MSTRVWLGSAAALMMAALPVSAQESGWTAWQGCWAPTGADAPAAQVVCVTPAAEPASVRVITVDDGAVAGETLLRADGVARPVNEGGCTGTETATFSQDGRRVYTRAELNCDGVRRVSTGVLALVTELEWIDVQAVSVGEQHATRVMRYRPAAVPASLAGVLPSERSLAVEAARLYAAAPLALEHVIEASQNLAAPVVEALVAARRHGYNLNARTLVLLRDAKVPSSTVDVLVALSYPQRFAVMERNGGGDMSAAEPQARSAFSGECYDPYWTTRRYRNDCYDRYGYGYGQSRYGYGYNDRYRSRSVYSPWGYDPYGWNYRDPIVVVVSPSDVDEGGDVVKGRGYTRSPNSAQSDRPTRRRTESGTAASAQPASSSTPSSTTGSSSAGEPTRTNTGRSAKPRGGGGN